MQSYLSTVSIQNLFVAVQLFRSSAMNSNIFVALLVLVIAFDFKCSGKSVANNLPDLFPIQKMARISATCGSDQMVTECNESVEYAIDGESKTFWRGPSLVNGVEFPEVDITFNFAQVNFWRKFFFYISIFVHYILIDFIIITDAFQFSVDIFFCF